MAKKCVVLETERLIMRGIDESDADLIVKWRCDKDAYKFFKNPHALTKEEHNNWFFNRYLSNEDRLDWMCIEKNSGEKIGVFGLIKENDCGEVNYLLDPEAQHKGYATECLNKIISYAKDVLKMESVIAEIHKKNSSSIALVKRLGFKLEKENGDFDIYRIEV